MGEVNESVLDVLAFNFEKNVNGNKRCIINIENNRACSAINHGLGMCINLDEWAI